MAKNKSPRKHYRPKPCYVPLWTEKDKSNIKALFEHAELVTMLKLPTGEARMDDLCCIRDTLNLCLMGCMTRDWLDKDEVKAAEPVIRRAGMALMTSVDKCIDRNPLQPRYVFTGDAIKAIQAGVAVAGPYINDSIDAIPGETVREFFAMKHLTRGKDARYAYSPEQLRRAIDRNTTIEWSQK